MASFKTKIFLSLLFFCMVSKAAEVSRCETVFARFDHNTVQVAAEAKKNLEKFEQVFTRARGLVHYEGALGKPFVERLDRLKINGGLWLDAGAGDGVAMSQFLQGTNNPEAKGVVISLESQKSSTERMKVFKGRFIEEIPSPEIPLADLITDVFGPLAYSGHPHLILNKYLQLLKPDGEILIFLGARDETYGMTNRVITSDGKYLSLANWIQQLSGLHTELVIDKREDEGIQYERWAMRIQRDSKNPVIIPEVELREFKEWAPPKMLFQEKTATNVQVKSQFEGLKEKVLEILSKKTTQLSFTQFMDSFRGGEITHPLIRAIKKLSIGKIWMNISNLKFDVQHGIKNKQFDASKTDVFWGLAQKWIRFRVNSINVDKFQYTNISTVESIRELKNLGLITDMYGDFVSSLKPDMILQRYLDSLSQDGSLFIYLGPEYTGFGASSEVLLKNGGRVNIRAWLQTIPGVQTQIFRGGYAYTGGQWTFVQIKKDKSSVKIPKLTLLGVDEKAIDEIPRMIFKEE